MLDAYVAVDLEMTGLKPGRDKILEIGAVLISGNRAREEFQCIVNPRRRVDEQVQLLTGITNEMAGAGEEEETAISGFLKFHRGLPIIGHNIIYDYSFLKQCAVNHGLTFETKALDTLKLARRFFPQMEKKTLDHLCLALSISRSQNHRALEDAKAAASLLELMRARFEAVEPLCFEPKPLNFKVKKQGPITPRQKKYLKELASYHKIELSVNVEDLTKSEASRLVDKLLTSYGRIP